MEGGVGPAAAALVPGVLLHGAGHYVGGDKATARKLLAAEGVGLGAVLVNGAILAGTGASRRFVGYVTAGVIGGMALFSLSLLADLYGAAGYRGGSPVTVAPTLESRMGLLYIYDPQFRYRWLLDSELSARLGDWKLAAAGTFALDDTNSLLRLGGGHRFVGPGPGRAARDGSFVDLDVGLSRHSYASERFALTTGEAMVSGRLDLARVSPSLVGSFAELGLGWAFQGVAYNVRNARADYNELLLGRFAFGVYLGQPGRLNGEASVFYDHRHDGYVAGLKMPGIPSGIAGHFGLRGRVFRGAWGLGAEAQAGSSYLVGLSLLHRQGGPW